MIKGIQRACHVIGGPLSSPSLAAARYCNPENDDIRFPGLNSAGSTSLSWPDVLLGELPNVYVYACNNPSESIIAKRRGFGTIISHNVPPYGRFAHPYLIMQDWAFNPLLVIAKFASYSSARWCTVPLSCYCLHNNVAIARKCNIYKDVLCADCFGCRKFQKWPAAAHLSRSIYDVQGRFVQAACRA